MEDLRVDGMIISGKLDHDKEALFEVRYGMDETVESFVTHDDAIKIVHHLCSIFDMDIAELNFSKEVKEEFVSMDVAQEMARASYIEYMKKCNIQNIEDAKLAAKKFLEVALDAVEQAENSELNEKPLIINPNEVN